MGDNMTQITIDWFAGCRPDELDLWEDQLCPQRADGKREGITGVYVWAFQGTPVRAAYIGESGDMWGRHHAHLTMLMTGYYTTYHAGTSDDLAAYYFDLVQKPAGEGARTTEEFGKLTERVDSPYLKLTFNRRFFSDNLYRQRRAFLDRLYFIFGKINSGDGDIRKQVEGALQWGAWGCWVRDLQKRDVRRSSFLLKNRPANDSPLGKILRYPPHGTRLEISHTGTARDRLPSDVSSVTGYENGRVVMAEGGEGIEIP